MCMVLGSQKDPEHPFELIPGALSTQGALLRTFVLNSSGGLTVRGGTSHPFEGGRDI